MDELTITDLEGLREIYPDPKGRPVEKQLPALDEWCRKFISLSPFLVLGTSGDVSPKGDEPGFVQVIDDKTILLPDRKGNNRLDSMSNIVKDPAVGMIFMIPGVNETLRVNGTAEITTDPALLEPLAVRGQVPKTGLLVHIEEAYLHCAKALIRSDLWNADKMQPKGTLPSGGRMIAEQTGGDPDANDKAYSDSLVKDLY